MSLPRVGAPGGRWDRLLPWLGAALGVLWFVVAGGGPTINPTNLDWAGGGDIAQHVLGWLHFRNAPWGFPLGRTPSLMYPLTVTVGFTDSNPWVAIALKPFSRWLPQDFQYVGPWLALCFALQGWMGVKLMALVSSGVPQRLLGAALFVLAPVLLFRVGHDTLCAHWMILAMVWLHLRPREDARAAWRGVGLAFVLNVLAAGIHPYLEVMIFILTVSLLFTVVRGERHLSWGFAGAALAGVLVSVGTIFFVLGYVGQGVSMRTSNDYGFYSADLLTFVNPMGWSRLLPSLPHGAGQYEGFGYLGTGSLALAGALLWRPSRWWPQAKAAVRAHAPLVLAVLALALLAFSSVVTVAGETVLTVRGLTRPFISLLAAFRSSGRFIWPLGYLMLLGILALVVWRWRQRPWVVIALLLGAVSLQVADTRDVWKWNRFRGDPWPRLQAPAWENVDSFYRHVVLFPPAIYGSEVPCVEGTFPMNAYVRFGDLAYRKGMTTNSAYSARLDEPKVQAVCEALKADIRSGRFAEDTLYVVGEKEREAFQRPGAGLTCGELDGYQVCVAAKEGRFREALMQAPASGR